MPFDIDARIDEWKKSLLDTTKRNRLIKFTSGRAGGVEFLHPAADPLWQQLVVGGRPFTFPWKREILGVSADQIDCDAAEASRNAADPGPAASSIKSDHGGHLSLTDAVPQTARPKSLRDLTAECLQSPNLGSEDLLTEFTDKKLAAHLLRLSRSAQEAETEHGVSTLYAAFGFLRWYESPDSQEEIRSPLVLAPVKLTRDSIESPWVLRAEGDDPTTNHCLAELMATEFRVHLPAGENTEIDTDGPGGLAAYLADVTKLVKSMPRWEVVEESALGVFNFQKLAMWQDLTKNADLVKGHKLCRVIAGDSAVEMRSPPGLVAAADLDECVAPETVTHILDADSSQHEAIEAVKRGADVVIDGPPGTGKSQTIANAIAELLAAGKTVLFVSEKTAALEVVKRRLDARGLGDFCLELHSHKANKREVAAELGRCLELGPEAHRDVSAELGQLAECRRRLNAYADELHRLRPPLNMTAYQVQGELARLSALPEQSRWYDPNIFARDAEYLRRATETLAGLTRCRPVVENLSAHSWRGCRLMTVTQTGLDDARHHLGRVSAVAARLSEGTTLADLALEGSADTFGRWRDAAVFARSVLAVSQVPPGWFAADPLACAAAALELHAATGAARGLSGKLAAFSPEALAALTLDSAAELARRLAGKRELLVEGLSLTARGRAESLRQLTERLADCSQVLEKLSTALARLLAVLRIPGKAVTTVQARKYAQVGRELADGGPVPPAWWNASRRVEVQRVAAKAAEEYASAQALRAGLAATLVPAAFALEVGAVVTQALRHGRSFWQRLLPKWGAMRQQVTGWYVGPAPDRAGMLAHLEALAQFHRGMSYVRQVEGEYAGELIAAASGQAAWAATAEGLSAVERYEKWKLPLELKAALAPGGGLDRVDLADAADGLTRAEHAFQTEWARLLKLYAPADPVEALNLPAAALTAQVRADAGAANAELETLGRLIGLLRDGHDLPPRSWVAQASELVELVRLRSQIATHASVLGLDGSPAAADWSSLAAGAERLRAFLTRIARQPSPATVAALTDEATRTRLRAAVDVSDQAIRDGGEESWAYLVGTLFSAEDPVSDGLILSQTPMPEVALWALSRLADLPRIDEWVRYARVRRDAAMLGVEAVVDEACDRKVGLGQAADAFRRRFFGQWLDALFTRVPELAEFSADDHDNCVNRFGQLDQLAVGAAPARLRSQLLAHPHRPHADGSAPGSSELGVVLREANKKKRHMPLRRLFAEIPTLLPRLKPCLMMSPLAVSTYLNSPALAFDAVIFDEASQVRPHDAICAVYRGRQLVVAGDPRQLPPTDFFARSVADDPDADEAEEGTAGFESLLDVCLSLGLVRKRLRWHYRSRREGLIAFSNKYFYDGGLVTFPSVDDGADPAVRLERVAEGQFEDGVNVVEARRTAELVVAHFRTSPALSLGVIAFSQRQQNQILDELEIQRRANPDLEEHFKEDRDERFFVKNLENVQGDERDVIMLSVGYGPDAARKVAMRFGPLNRQGGERRLNVAITRARSAMTVVASIGAADIDLSRTQAEGARLMRAFLDYADRGPRALAEAVTSADGGFDSPFEQEVFEELRRRGLMLHKQVGCGGFKIDMAVVDPAASGRYLLGVECDGATYHSSATARDRDRLRQAVLEGLGWRLCRIWSTDWLRNREKQVLRVLTALDSPVRRRDVTPEKAPVQPVRVIPLLVAAAAVPLPAPTYANIDEVPELVILTTALAVIAEYGTTKTDDLCVTIARRLGFKRLGARIKTRVQSSLDALVLEKKLVRQSDDRWGPSIAIG